MNNKTIAIIYLFNAFILAGTSYIVFWKGESPWWFLFSVLLISVVKTKEKDEL